MATFFAGTKRPSIGIDIDKSSMSTVDDLVWLTCRTPDNIVVNLPDVDDAALEGYRRA